MTPGVPSAVERLPDLFRQHLADVILKVEDFPDDLVMAPSADAEPAIEDDSFKDRLKALSARTGG